MKRHIVPSAALGLLLAACQPPDTAPERDDSDVEFRVATWDEWPIVIDQVNTTSKIENYEYDFDHACNTVNPPTLGDLVDVATVLNHKFVVTDMSATDPELTMFKWTGTNGVEAKIDAADAEGISLIVPLGFYVSASDVDGNGLDQPGDATECNSASIPNGYDWVWNSTTSECELWTDDLLVRLPFSDADLEDVGSAFRDWWGDRVEVFIEEVEAEDANDVVWGFRGHDEQKNVNKWQNLLSREMRERVDAEGGGRFVTAYFGNDFRAKPGFVENYIEKPHSDQTPYNQATFDVTEPTDSVWQTAGGTPPNCSVSAPPYHPNALWDDYPFNRVDGGTEDNYLRPVYQHIVSGNYTPNALGDYADTNSILSLHRLRLKLEIRDVIESIYAANNTAESITQAIPSHKVFHLPTVREAMWDNSLTNVPELARHEFAVGLHDADGLWIWSIDGKETCYDQSTSTSTLAQEDAYEWMLTGAKLIKDDMRDYLVNGVKSNPPVTITTAGADEVVSATEYCDEVWRDDTALPASPDDYATVNATSFRVGSVAYVVVTSSADQTVDFEIDMGGWCIDALTDIEVKYPDGEDDDLGLVSGDASSFEDTLYHVDARIYKVTLVAC